MYNCIYASILYICLYDINKYAHFYAYIYYKHRKMNIFDVTSGIVPARKPLYVTFFAQNIELSLSCFAHLILMQMSASS